MISKLLLLILVILIGLLCASGVVLLSSTQISISNRPFQPIPILAWSLFFALTEEFIFRNLALSKLKWPRIKSRIFFSAVLFSCLHSTDLWSWYVFYFSFAYFQSVVFLLHGFSMTVIIHFAWNFLLGLFYGLPGKYLGLEHDYYGYFELSKHEASWINALIGAAAYALLTSFVLLKREGGKRNFSLLFPPHR